MYRVTTPKEKEANLELLPQAIQEFEKAFKALPNGRNKYAFFVNTEYPIIVCREIQQIYKEAGWKTVYCISSPVLGTTTLMLEN